MVVLSVFSVLSCHPLAGAKANARRLSEARSIEPVSKSREATSKGDLFASLPALRHLGLPVGSCLPEQNQLCQDFTEHGTKEIKIAHELSAGFHFHTGHDRWLRPIASLIHGIFRFRGTCTRAHNAQQVTAGKDAPGPGKLLRSAEPVLLQMGSSCPPPPRLVDSRSLRRVQLQEALHQLLGPGRIQ